MSYSYDFLFYVLPWCCRTFFGTQIMVLWCPQNFLWASKILNHLEKQLEKAKIHTFFSIRAKGRPPVFGGVFEIQPAVENFLNIILPWCGYLKCSTRVGEHVEQKIKAIRHPNQKLWTKTKKCRQKKSFEG